MEKVSTQPQSRTTAAKAAPTAANFDHDRELKKLQNTVRDMDAMSQEAAGQISALAKMLLTNLQSIARPVDLELIATMLELIWSKAEILENDINASAESVGCEYVDEERRARTSALLRIKVGGAS